VAHGKAPDRVRREDGTPVVNPASGIALDAAPARRPAVAAAMASLDPHRALADAIVDFRREPRHQSAPAGRDHEDIDAVMLAASLAPEGSLPAVRAPSRAQRAQALPICT
jgi:hypothetical protein